MDAILHRFGRYLLYATALTPVIFIGSFYFPFIVPRTIYFRLLIGLVFIIFLILWRGRSPLLARIDWKKNYAALAVGLLWLSDLFSSVFGLSWLNSLFGDIERSWGLYTLTHIYLFYFLLRVFFAERDWKIFFHCLVGSGTVAALYGIVQYYPDIFGVQLFQAGPGRILSTLGNPAYAAIIFIFSGGLALYLGWQKKLYWAIALVNFFALTLTDVRGAYLGFLAGLTLALAILVVTASSVRLRRSAGGLLLFLIMAGALVFAFRDDPFIKTIPLAGRLSTISASSSTAVTRLIGWRAAWRGFKENPALGVGLENFGVVFNKYFDPIYYSYASSEPYFDRAHNSFLDRLATGGLVGLLTFLGLIVALAFYLWRGYKQRKFSRPALVILAGLNAAYLTHIIFVFDDINSLLFFLALAALVEFKFRENENLPARRARRVSESLAIPIALAGIGVAVWYGLVFNIRTAQVSRAEIKAILAQSEDRNYEMAMKYYQQALAVPYMPRLGFLKPYIDWLVEVANAYKKVPSPGVQKLFDDSFVVLKSALEKEIRANHYNPLFFLKLSTLYGAHYLVHGSAEDKSLAEAYIKAAIELSPDRPQYYNLLAETEVIFGEGKKAVEAAERSLALNENYHQTYIYLVRAYAAGGDLDQALDYYRKLLGRGYIATSDEAAADLGAKFIKSGQLAKAQELYELWLKASPNNTKALINLTILAIKMNRLDEAVSYAEQVAQADNSIKGEVDYIIQEIKAGRIEPLLKQFGF